ncbi:hypothetical protein AU255_03290 [Methyloprofundus sedimenti]|uniref:Uncharacterized protein n=1 Tax=Methyloprofundus sedimenti TaxID=1420851 RepID=A0A1V8M614_9GAMM|nr:hypothetical protein [Methyloprofundus sedimenti]OQK16938.1 hypothetical protein AU255_03290 [Methyloprofundus sedimenti]
MDTYKFNTTHIETHFQVPFKLTEKAFNQWFLSLKNSSTTEQEHQVLLAILAINQENTLSKHQKSLLLQSIYKSMLIFLTPLSEPVLNSSLPLAKHDRNNIQNIVSIYAELANGFESCLIKTSELSNVVTLFYGLQALINAYIYISEVYQQVYTDFWKQAYKFYGLASKLEIQDINIEQHGYHSNTVSKAFKHLLALHHCELEQFRPRDMQTISACVEKHTSIMLLDTKFPVEKTSQYSGLNLTTDKPPINLTHFKQSEQGAIRFFSAYTAAIQINKNATHEAPGTGVIKAINREHIIQASKSLSLSQRRKFTRFNQQTEHNGIIGFNHIIKQLHDASPLTPVAKNKNHVDQTSSKVAGGWAVPDIQLVTEGYEPLDAIMRDHHRIGLLRNEQSKLDQAKKYALRKNIWATSDPSPQSDAPINPDTFYIVNSSIKGYRIIFDTDINHSTVQIGDIIGINNHNSLEIGIVCRLAQLTENKLQLGIKLLALGSEISYISVPSHDAIYAWAIFLQGIKALNSSDSLIFNDGKFQPGEFINLHRANIEPVICRLNKLLHLSSAAMHIELFIATAKQ